MKNIKPVAILLTPVLPQSGGSGRSLRAWHWLQTLSQTYRVYIMVTDPCINITPLSHNFSEVNVLAIDHTLQSTSPLYARITLLFPFLVLVSKKCVVDWLHPLSNRLINLCLDDLVDEPVKYILVFRFYLHDVAISISERFPEAIIDLDMDDYEPLTRLSVAGAQVRLGRYADALRSFSAAIQYWFMERLVLKGYRTVYLAAEKDCPLIPTGKETVISCRSNKILFPAYFPLPPLNAELSLLFVGSLSYPPNEEAVKTLVISIFPELQRRINRPIRLSVIGRHPSPDVKSLLERAAHVDFIADADDLTASYAKTHIVLIPLRAGGGTKLKTLEAFAFRRPVVSTRHGVRGLRAVSGEHYLHAETPMEFAEAVMRLERDQTLALQIAQAGWELCARNFRIE